MSDTNVSQQHLSELQADIDRIATALIVRGEAESFISDLRQLSGMAASHGYEATAKTADDLSRNLNYDPSASGSTFDVAAAAALYKLQQVLKQEAEQRASAPAQSDAPPPSVPPPSLAQDPELIGDFVLESREHLASIESQMLELEQNGTSSEVINSVFRAFHTIKGLAGFLEFPNIQSVAHEVETLLDLARNQKLAITTPVVDVVLESADFLCQAIDAVEASLSGTPYQQLVPAPGLIASIQRAASGAANPVTTSAAGKTEPLGQNLAEAAPPLAKPAPVPPIEAPQVLAPAPSSATDVKTEVSVAGKTVKAAESFSVRVETAKLDHLLDTVGEMVIAQSLIRHNPRLNAIQDPRLLGDLSQLARITAEVQRTTMGMRMIPMGQLFQRTTRMVRDLSRKTGKLVELEINGDDTEVDKSIAEELADPMLHMVRNSMDHGIETPAEREAAGKPRTAVIRLSAHHQAGQIVIEIGDDGRGLDKQRILKKAQQNGIAKQGAQLSDAEIYQLIFEPGFSTAEKITDISGRGVGMDVVRRNVQKLRGRIDIQSTPGHGAKFLLNLPLTLAIIDGLVVEVGDHRYVLPIFDVKEIFRPATEVISSVRGRDEMALVRGRLLPIVRLYSRFNVTPRSHRIEDGLLVVAEAEGKPFCLLVDDLVGKQEVVIKSLGEVFKNVHGVAGCAILGDGRVGLILDLSAVFRGTR